MSLKTLELLQSDCAAVLNGKISMLDKLRDSTVVVTGGTGFVGKWIAELIGHLNVKHSFGTQLVLISRRAEVFKAMCPHLCDRADIEILPADIRYLSDLPKATRWLIHAAGTPDARFHSTNPVETMLTTADGTAAVLRAAERCSDFRMLLNVSSGLIYGSQPFDMEKISESYQGSVACGVSSSSYADSKRFAETLCAAARSQARIPVMSVRPFAFIGPYQSLDSPWAVNNFIRDAMSGNSIRVLGDGQTLRSYLYASDMAFWLLKMLTGGSQGDVYNIGSSSPVTLSSLAEKVASHFSPNPAIVLRAGTATNVPKSIFIPDVDKAKQRLGLDVTVPLDEAIKRTVQWNMHTLAAKT